MGPPLGSTSACAAGGLVAGRRFTDPADLLSGTDVYAMRDLDRLRAMAAAPAVSA